MNLDKYFSDFNQEAKEIVFRHSRAVAELALSINENRNLGLNPEEIEFAAMIHDVGISMTNAPGLHCYGESPYILHGVKGAEKLRQMGAPEWAARVAERHTGTGLYPEDIARQHLPLPTDGVFYPQTTLEKLICYADKFYSKRVGSLTRQKTLDEVRQEMQKFGDENLKRFEELNEMFELKN